MAEFRSLSIYEITDRLYGVRTRTTSEEIIIAADGTIIYRLLQFPHNPNRIAWSLQNRDSRNPLFISLGEYGLYDGSGGPGGLRLNGNETLSYTVYEDIGAPAEQINIYTGTANAQPLFFSQTLVDPVTLGGA